jgi:hypothetical protein
VKGSSPKGELLKAIIHVTLVTKYEILIGISK